MKDITTSRREFLRMIGLSGLATATGTGLLAGCNIAEQPTPTQAAASSGEQARSPDDMSLKVGYLPITDATPLLLAHAQGLYADEGLDAERPTLFRGWSAVAEAFQARQVDVVHMLMPVAVWMRFGQNFPVKLVAWDHTDGSALTVAKDINTFSDLAGTTVAVPFWYSIHNLVLQLMLRNEGLNPITQGEPSASEGTVKLVVMAPPDMAPALGQGSIAGYIVADPFNAVAELNDVGRIQRFTGDIWFNHACCVVLMHEDDISTRPEWAQAVVTAIARAQVFARENREETARILSSEGDNYLPQPLEVIRQALSHYDHDEYTGTGAIQNGDWQNNRIDFQPFPFPSYTAELVRLLKETTVEGDSEFLATLDPEEAHDILVDDRFARDAIEAVGGPGQFGISESLSRTERIEVS